MNFEKGDPGPHFLPPPPPPPLSLSLSLSHFLFLSLLCLTSKGLHTHNKIEYRH